MTHRWECQVFDFILEISEVNAFLILCYFVYCGLHREGMPKLQDLCRKLAWQLINNIYIGERDGVFEFLPECIQQLMTAKRHTRGYHNRKWICTAKTAYQ